jgi:hypothetical protein
MIFLVSLALVTTAMAYPSNPPLGYAGDPPANNNCTNCHGGNPLNAAGGSVTISGLPTTGYVPGTTYHLTVTQARTGLTRWGFELTAIYQSGTSWLQAGTLIVTDATHTNLGVGTGTAPDYIRQTSSGTYVGQPNQASWNFDWTAPNPAIGPIGFYTCGLACNGTGGTGGDWGYTTSSTVNPAASGPSLDVTLTPVNPPITVPAGGGSFQFNAGVVRAVGPQAPFSVWARIKYPDGTYTAPTLGPVTVNPPVGTNVTRLRNQNIPSTYPPGAYVYLGYANNTYSYPAVDSSSFPFTKSAVAGSEPIVGDANCWGELFPGEQAVVSPAGFAIVEVYPNPFNPTTTLSYQLSANSPVHLQVFDTAGRLVATLAEGWQEAGSHQARFDGSGLAAGLYFVRLQAGNVASVTKMMLVK